MPAADLLCLRLPARDGYVEDDPIVTDAVICKFVVDDDLDQRIAVAGNGLPGLSTLGSLDLPLLDDVEPQAVKSTTETSITKTTEAVFLIF